MAITREDDRTAVRGQWTLKSKLLTQEVMIAIRLAAQKAERPIGDWCAEVLHEQAREALGRPIEKPMPPARIEEVVAERLDMMWERQQAEMQEREQRMRDEQAAALRASEERMEQLVSGLAREGRRGRWRR